MTTSPAPAALSRKEDILRAAAGLFADRGYHGVGVDEIGAAVGITGPGLYRHFKGKKAMLAELLVGISRRLLDGGLREVEEAESPEDALDALIRWHIGFALDSPELITLHGRELTHLSDKDRKLVRRLQRQYVELWVDVVAKTHPDVSAAAAGTVDDRTDPPETRVRAAVHAVFGLINSTPYSWGPTAAAHHDDTLLPGRPGMETLLERLAHGALGAI